MENNSTQINWPFVRNTLRDILGPLVDFIALAEVLSVSKYTVYGWVNPDKSGGIYWDNLVGLSKLVGISLDDLLVGGDRDFVIKDLYHGPKILKTPDEIRKYMDFNAKRLKNEKWSYAYLLLMIYMLVDSYDYADCAYRANGNWGNNNEYLLSLIRYLYRTIPEGDEKEFINDHIKSNFIFDEITQKKGPDKNNEYHDRFMDLDWLHSADFEAHESAYTKAINAFLKNQYYSKLAKMNR